jgi:hypothetical protein
MSVIKARVGPQNVVRVLSNNTGIPQSVKLIDLIDVNTDLKTQDGMILVWDLPTQTFIMTSVIDSSSTTIEGIAYFVNDTDSTLPTNGALVVSGGVGIGKNLNVGSGLKISGISTFASDLDINAAVDILNGLTVGSGLTVSGVSTFASDVNVNGQTTLNNLFVSGLSTFSGITTTIDDLYVGSDLFVKDNLQVNGTSEFIGTAIFRGGTIGIGDSITDNIDIGGEFVSNLVPNVDDTYDIGITSQRWRNGNFSGLVTTTDLYVSGTSTFEGTIEVDGNLSVVGFISVTEGLYYDFDDYNPPNGIGYFDNTGKLVSSASTANAIDTSNYILTTEDITGSPVWTSTIDGGFY